MRKLTDEQKKVYEEKGYLVALPVFNEAEVVDLNENLQHLLKLLKPGEKHFQIRGWHRTSRWLYDVCTDPRILDYVEDLLGPNFYLWGTHFFSKAPNSSDTVAWHQDAPYWPLHPHNAVTVWLAFTDVDEANGAMKVIPGTHKAGLMKHKGTSQSTNVLSLELDTKTYTDADAASLLLKAGEISIHDDAIVHGSLANLSDRWRIGVTLRFSSTDVKCDLKDWPHFDTYLVRGVDDFKLNPVGKIPAEKFGRFDWNWGSNNNKN